MIKRQKEVRKVGYKKIYPKQVVEKLDDFANYLDNNYPKANSGRFFMISFATIGEIFSSKSNDNISIPLPILQKVL